MSDAITHTPPGEPDRSLRYSILEGAMYTLMTAVTAGSVRIFFATHLGATDADFGLLTAMGTLAALGAVAGSQVVGRLRSRKRAIMLTIWNRLLWFLVAAIPLMGLAGRTALHLLMAVVFCTAFLDTMLGNAWLSWMSDLMPPERRSRYFGIRSSIHSAIGMAAGWGVGHAFDAMRLSPRVGEPLVYLPLFAFAGISGALSIWFMSRKWEPPAHGEAPIPLVRALTIPFRHAPFRRLIFFYICWTLVTAVSTPFWQPHMIRNLHMDGGTIAVYTILSGAIGLVSQPLWGRIIDRMGARPVLTLNLIGVSGLPLFWLFARPDFLWGIWTDALLTGLFWPGFNLAAFSLNLTTAPREHRSAYLATLTLATGLTGFLANLAGGWIASAAGNFHLDWHGFTLVNYHAIFVLSAVGRIAMLPLARRLNEERTSSVVAVLGFAGTKATETLAEAFQRSLDRVMRIYRPGQDDRKENE